MIPQRSGSRRRRLPNELYAEIANTLPLGRKFELSCQIAQQQVALSSFDQYVLESVQKSAIPIYNSWDSDSCDRNLALSDDLLTITHKGSDGYGSVRSKLPVPRKRSGIFYFETLVRTGGIVNIGLSVGGPNTRVPFIVGYSAGSCSYDDTGKFVVCRKNYDYGPGYRAGDRIGCGVELSSRQLFFTQNGTFIGIATVLPSLDRTDLYPTITLLDSTIIEANFGRMPFMTVAQLTLNRPKLKRWEEAEEELGQKLHSRAAALDLHNARLHELLILNQQGALARRRLEFEQRQLELDYRLMRRQFERERRRMDTMRDTLDKMSDGIKAGPSRAKDDEDKKDGDNGES